MRFFLYTLVLFCSSCSLFRSEVIYPLPSTHLVLEDGVVSDQTTKEPILKVICVVKNDSLCRGILVFHYQQSKYEWVFPEEGLTVKRWTKVMSEPSLIIELAKGETFWVSGMRVGDKKPSKGTMITSWAEIKGFSEDFKTLNYSVPGMFFSSDYTYNIERAENE